MKKNYLGIDPGKNGALFLIHSSGLLEGFVFPKIGNDIDLHQLAKIFKSIPPNTEACLESVHAMHNSSAKASFEFGGTFFMLQMALAMSDIPFKLVRPMKWQEVMHNGITQQYKTVKGVRSKDPKAMSLISFKQHFPGYDATPSARATKFHDGIVDAALIAWYARKAWQ